MDDPDVKALQERLKEAAILLNAAEGVIDRMRKRIMGKMDSIEVGDYVEVKYKDGSGKLKGTVTKVWPIHGQIQVNNGWCAHPEDEVLVHNPSPQ